MPKPEVLAAAGFSATTLWREMKAERFPRPISISPQRKGWLESQVRKWQQGRIKATGQPNQPKRGFGRDRDRD